LPLGGAKQRAVLALLLLHANEVVSTDRLIDELWGDSPPESAANMLQGYVSHLRKALEPGRGRGEHELIVSRVPGYVLQIRPDQLDAERFERLSTEGRRLLADREADAAAKRLRAALALWRGGALDDLAYEAFARADIDRLEELRLQTLEDRIDADLALGRHGALVAELRELVDRHPLRERLRAQLMAALYRYGRQAEALAVYRDARRVLLDELGVEPGPALRGLEQAILRQDPALGAPAPPPAPLAARVGRRRPLLVGAAALAGVVLGVVLAFGRSGGAKAVVVKPHSVAVIDPSRNALVDDIAVGAYPGPLTADDEFVYVGNTGDATLSRIFPDKREVYDTGSLSRAIDLVAVDKHLWAADGGVVGHTLAPPGTVLDYDLLTARARTIRLGPPVEGDEEQTTIAADAVRGEIWAGNKDSQTVTQLAPATMATIHGIAPGGLAVVRGADGRDTVWASDPNRNLVVRIDAATKQIVQRIRIAGFPSRVAADARALWVIDRGYAGVEWKPTRFTKPALWRIDPMSNRPVVRIPLPLTPIRVALGAGSVWVTAERVLSYDGATADATLLRVDLATNRIVRRIPLHTRHRRDRGQPRPRLGGRAAFAIGALTARIFGLCLSRSGYVDLRGYRTWYRVAGPALPQVPPIQAVEPAHLRHRCIAGGDSSVRATLPVVVNSDATRVSWSKRRSRSQGRRSVSLYLQSMSPRGTQLVSSGVVAALLLGAPASGAEARQSSSCDVPGALPSPPTPRPHYALSVRVRSSLRAVTGSLTVTFTAPPDHGTDRLVFRLWPNGSRYASAGARLSVSRVREGRRALPVADPDPTTLVVARPLAAGGQVVVSMDWRLVLPRESGLRIKGGGRSVRLGSFFPLLAWDGNDWALDPPTRLPSAEAWTTPTADFDVRVTHPRRLRALASGQQVGSGTWRARAVRDFTLSLGHFTVVKGTAHVPGPVHVTVGLESVPGAAPARVFLQRAIRSLDRYSVLYGPYPWSAYTVVAMADLTGLTGGLEYPTLVYQPATSENVPHETAHQWFYSLVGNDQAHDPWLDEGLVTWAEAAVNGTPPFPDATIPPEVANKIGEPMSFWDQFDPRRYFLGTYLQTYRALLSIGPRSQVDCALRLYVLRNAYRVARPRDLLDALQGFFPDAEQKLEAHGAHF